MKRKIRLLILSFIFLFFILYFTLTDVLSQSISSSELINNAKEYDGKTVIYSGEAIGDIMLRGEYAWINVNDGKNAIGIWVKKDFVKDIIYTGSYNANGDLVEISGVFNRACIFHGGDLDIHAYRLTKTSSGNLVSHRINIRGVNFVLCLFIALILACLVRAAVISKNKLRLPR